MVRIIVIQFGTNYSSSFLFESLDITEIVNKIISLDLDFDECRVIFPDLSERIWKAE